MNENNNYPTQINGDFLRKSEFSLKLRGYDPEEVDAIIDTCANELDQLWDVINKMERPSVPEVVEVTPVTEIAEIPMVEVESTLPPALPAHETHTSKEIENELLGVRTLAAAAQRDRVAAEELLKEAESEKSKLDALNETLLHERAEVEALKADYEAKFVVVQEKAAVLNAERAAIESQKASLEALREEAMSDIETEATTRLQDAEKTAAQIISEATRSVLGRKTELEGACGAAEQRLIDIQKDVDGATDEHNRVSAEISSLSTMLDNERARVQTMLEKHLRDFDGLS